MAGRKKVAPAEPATDMQIVERTPPEMAAQEIAAREAGELVSIDQAMGWMQLSDSLASIQGLQFVATVADRAIAETYVKVKKSKAYVGIPYRDQNGNVRLLQTLDEFCRTRLGKSYRRCEELATNLELLGGELYDAAQKMGLGQRDYNALKVLPADDQEVIRQAIAEGGDRDAVVGMLTQLVERQAVEKTELKADLVAKDEVAAKKSARITKLEEDLAKARRQARKATPDETLATLRSRLTEVAVGIEAEINASGDVGSLRRWVGEVMELANAHDLDVMPMLAGSIAQIERVLWCLRDEFGIPHAAVGSPQTEADMALGKAV